MATTKEDKKLRSELTKHPYVKSITKARGQRHYEVGMADGVLIIPGILGIAPYNRHHSRPAPFSGEDAYLRTLYPGSLDALQHSLNNCMTTDVEVYRAAWELQRDKEAAVKATMEATQRASRTMLLPPEIAVQYPLLGKYMVRQGGLMDMGSEGMPSIVKCREAKDIAAISKTAQEWQAEALQTISRRMEALHRLRADVITMNTAEYQEMLDSIKANAEIFIRTGLLPEEDN